MKFQAIKGVRDILPPESALWNRVEQSAREMFATYGFAEIRLPNFEQTELFARSVGLETDIVSKEMFQVSRVPSEQDLLIEAASLKAARICEALVSAGNLAGFPQVEEAVGSFLNQVKAAATGDEPAVGSEDVRRLAKMEAYHRQAKSMPRLVYATQMGIMLRAFGQESRWSLRPEATASVVRAYIEHGMHTLPGNVKLYYMGPMFRRERPQKGRYRQFYQIGAEVLGPSDAPGIDAEVIEMLMAFFSRVKLEGAALYLNSIGCQSCRPAYVKRLREELEKVRAQLGPDSQRRIETNPLRVFDSKLESEQAIIEQLPRIAGHLCADCRAHYDEVKCQLALRGTRFQENWRLVRGLDYYTRTTFEIAAPGLGSQNAVCGGGRYDGLVELLGGPAATKGIGFAIGTDRLVLSLQQAGAGGSSGGLDVYVAWFGGKAQPAAVQLARRLREAGFSVELPATELKFGKSLSLADRLKARYAVILGEDEIAAGVFTVKRLADGTQQKFAEDELFSHLRAALSVKA
jgi:histidyl-tRNA synthetase